jgi:hypothetical protein
VEDVNHPGKMLLNLGENGGVAIFLYTEGSGCQGTETVFETKTELAMTGSDGLARCGT